MRYYSEGRIMSDPFERSGLTQFEIDTFRRCSDVFLQYSSDLPAFAFALDAMAEMLLAFADDKRLSKDLMARVEKLMPMVARLQHEQMRLAMITTAELLKSISDREDS